MVSLYTILFLGLSIFSPMLVSAGFATGAEDVYWRHADDGTTRTDNLKQYAGVAHIKWTKSNSCTIPGDYDDTTITFGGENDITVTAETIGGSRDFMDPKKIQRVRFARITDDFPGLEACDANGKIIMHIYPGGDRAAKEIVIEVDNICTDKDCPGKKRPKVNCLKGPKGKVIMYRQNWVDGCTDSY